MTSNNYSKTRVKALNDTTSKTKVWVTNTLPLSVSMLVGCLMLAGCQTTAVSHSANNTPAMAKSTLQKALQKQRMRSFSYHTDVKIKRDMTSAKDVNANSTTTEPLITSQYVDTYCEDTHDTAYVELLEQADEQGTDIDSADFTTQRNTIKSAYLACSEAYDAWAANRASDYNDYDNEDDASNAADIDDSQYEQQPVSPYYQDIFDNFDDKPKALDAKKSKLLNEYLLKPLSINAQGSYQPAAGKFTMLTSAQYMARNNHMSINQPLYFDASTGSLYLWADNFAFATSEYLDEKLGTSWQNKWLKLTLNDGTLPSGFGHSLIKAHFEAMDRIYDSAPTAQFDMLPSSQLTSVLPNLDEQRVQPMTSTRHIIRRVQTPQEFRQYHQDYLTTLYDIIAARYPQLIVNADEAQSDSSAPDNQRFTSKALVEKLLMQMKALIDMEADRRVYGAMVGEDSIEDETTQLTGSIQELYGLDNRGQIKWKHTHNQTANVQSNDGVTFDIMQQYQPLSSSNIDFPNLPKDRQQPNESNTVDVREYQRELLARYKKGEGTAIGKLLYQGFFDALTAYPQTSDYQSDEKDGTEPSQ